MSRLGKVSRILGVSPREVSQIGSPRFKNIRCIVTFCSLIAFDKR